MCAWIQLKSYKFIKRIYRRTYQKCADPAISHLVVVAFVFPLRVVVFGAFADDAVPRSDVNTSEVSARMMKFLEHDVFCLNRVRDVKEVAI